MARHAWDEAVDAFSAADRAGGLSPEDLEQLGAASWWAGRPDDAIEALERAFGAYTDAGRESDAGRVALDLAYQGFRRQATSIALGWLGRAERILASQPESAVHARIPLFAGLGELMANHYAEGVALLDQAMEIARRHGDANVASMALSFKGTATLYSGDWRAGLADIDEAATAAASNTLDLRVASDIYCNTIAACRNIGDYKRAGQWTEEAERWMRRQSVGGYPGICHVHRAELKMLRGEWSAAEQEARDACDELQRWGLIDSVGWAHYQIGEVRLRMGDLDAAGEAFDRAYEYGHDAQPGLALLQLQRGEIDEATRSIARALAMTDVGEGAMDRAARARLLPAQVDIALAAGDLATAGAAVAELEAIATDFERPVFRAGALTGRGELLLEEHRPAEASPILGRSWRLWQETDLPLESARARLRYAEALAAEGDESTSRRDLRAARSVFERLGATLDLQRVDALLGDARGQSGHSSARATKTFMFTDIVTSTDLIGLIGDDAWAELISWHDRELRACFAQHRGEEVNSTGDGFFVAFERPIDGVECAVDIQRRLARHRRDHGFAPKVRIGLHSSDATREGRDYRGRGVHIAARIGAAASADEILISEPVAAGLSGGRFGTTASREIVLKGIDTPVDVRSVDWR
jgi:class 3 adenylate cyclase